MVTASIIATSFIPSPPSPPGAAGFGGEVAVLEEINYIHFLSLKSKYLIVKALWLYPVQIMKYRNNIEHMTIIHLKPLPKCCRMEISAIFQPSLITNKIGFTNIWLLLWLWVPFVISQKVLITHWYLSQACDSTTSQVSGEVASRLHPEKKVEVL